MDDGGRLFDLLDWIYHCFCHDGWMEGIGGGFFAFANLIDSNLSSERDLSFL